MRDEFCPCCSAPTVIPPGDEALRESELCRIGISEVDSISRYCTCDVLILSETKTGMIELEKLRSILLRFASIILLVIPACGQTPRSPTAWRDLSKHQTTFVTVAEGVRLEVLDWAAQDGVWYCSQDPGTRHTSSMSSRQS
jgi:hypothetical protein